MARKSGRITEVDAYFTFALEGIWRAAESFDPSKGVPLLQHVSIKARYIMLDLIRDQDEFGRLNIDTIKKIDKVEACFMQEHHRLPDDDELIALIGGTRRSLRVAMLSRRYFRYSGGFGDDDVIDRLDAMCHVTQDPARPMLEREALDRALLGLSKRDKQIVMLRIAGLTEKKIGEQLGLSESRVCQLMQKLRPRIERRLAA